MKMFPVVATCRTDEKSIRETASTCLKNVFKDVEHFTYCCNFKIRNNSEMVRMKVLPWVCDTFSHLDSKTSVDFSDPDYVISVDIIKSVCCFSILKKFFRYKKYNLQEIVAARESPHSKEDKDKCPVIRETANDSEIQKSEKEVIDCPDS